MSRRSPSSNGFAAAKAQFAASTKNHQLTVLHDDGPYRHLRFAQPGTGIWSWSIITYPNHLVTSGDVADGYIFQHPNEPDMLRFFGSSARGDTGEVRINVDYWSQKMPHTMTQKSYSEDVYSDFIDDTIDEWAQQLSNSEAEQLRLRANAALHAGGHETPDVSFLEGAHQALQDFRFVSDDLGYPLEFPDPWEYSFNEYDHHLILAMLAVSWGIAQYDAAQAADPTTKE